MKSYIYSNLYMLELAVTLEQAESAAHQGECDEDVKTLCSLPEIREQTDAWDTEKLKRELSEFGAWEDEELEDREANVQRLVWSLCWECVEEARADDND